MPVLCGYEAQIVIVRRTVAATKIHRHHLSGLCNVTDHRYKPTLSRIGSLCIPFAAQQCSRINVEGHRAPLAQSHLQHFLIQTHKQLAAQTYDVPSVEATGPPHRLSQSASSPAIPSKATRCENDARPAIHCPPSINSNTNEWTNSSGTITSVAASGRKHLLDLLTQTWLAHESSKCCQPGTGGEFRICRLVQVLYNLREPCPFFWFCFTRWVKFSIVSIHYADRAFLVFSF